MGIEKVVASLVVVSCLCWGPGFRFRLGHGGARDGLLGINRWGLFALVSRSFVREALGCVSLAQAGRPVASRGRDCGPCCRVLGLVLGVLLVRAPGLDLLRRIFQLECRVVLVGGTEGCVVWVWWW